MTAPNASADRSVCFLLAWPDLIRCSAPPYYGPCPSICVRTSVAGLNMKYYYCDRDLQDAVAARVIEEGVSIPGGKVLMLADFIKVGTILWRA